MVTKYRIHPAVDIARLGNSPDAFYLSPENPAQIPQACDANGNPRYGPDGTTPEYVTSFKDRDGRIKRQAARFQVLVYDDAHPDGRPLRIGDRVEGGGNHGTLIDIQWRAYLANKKASWYQFNQLEGEHGYAPGHVRRNPQVPDELRQRLIIDPGPRIVSLRGERRAAFDRDAGGHYATTFPPDTLKPYSIDTLGDLLVDDDGRLLVLGGHGRAGSELTGPGNPRIEHYANNDGWYDDTSDGPVMARLMFFDERVQRVRFVDADYPAWVVAGYPRFAPEVLDMITMDEVVYDMFLHQFAYDTKVYGTAGTFNDPPAVDPMNPGALQLWLDSRLTYNPGLKPWFFRDVWPILFRPDEFTFLTDVLGQSNFPHSQETRGTFDVDKLQVVPKRDPEGRIVDDPYGDLRRFLFSVLRMPGEENDFKVEGKVTSRIHNLPLMPLLAGDNPISNTLPSKFLALTDTQLFILKQWAEGDFINEIDEGWLDPKTYSPYQPYPTQPPKTGRALDQGVLGNIVGGAFCPGGEVGWVMRNPSIWREPYRIKADQDFWAFERTAAQANTGGTVPETTYIADLGAELSQDNDFARGLQPGDLTKYMAQPWQADFNECSMQPINVTYADWNVIYPGSDMDARLRDETKVWNTLWWPAHRPMQVYTAVPGGSYVQLNWASGIQQTNAGDLKMVSAWSGLGFVVINPANSLEARRTTAGTSLDNPKYINTEQS